MSIERHLSHFEQKSRMMTSQMLKGSKSQKLE
jgi:hypothetical protein